MAYDLPPLAPDAPIFIRVLPRLRELAEEAFAAALAAVPEAVRLSNHESAQEMVPLTLEGAGLFLRGLYEQKPVTRAELGNAEVHIARLAEDGIPLTAVIGAFFGGIQTFWTAISESAAPEDSADLAAFGSHMLAYVQLISLVTAETYGSVQQSMFGAEREARRSLCSALLRGESATELAAHAGVTLAGKYDVVTIIAGVTHPPIDAAATLVTRRWVRWAQELLDDLAGGPVLTTFDGVSGTALLPAGAVSAARVESLADTLAVRFGVDVYVAQCNSVGHADIPAAVRESTDVADLARRLGRRTGLHTLSDMLLEYQITRPGPARALIIEQLAPVIEQPHLMEALDAHIRHGLDRKSAAGELHVHPNTFSYRLRRVADLTGIDPSDPYGSRLLAAALTIHRALPIDP
ncbi:CdaR family transcriptional regulator [Antrihabitans sp. YC2-6]|uniref:PucR family transcriptional regulator n=1 Tax=Antrihabitans sp. YC2-6 TaxID=2799498 RepID=UPI0018F53EA2|nr:helix-turn-helix domain-containing protein [Antrihabitans sp. YC2-6]MBJ8345421.1 helix-turn-helix domain-containing protein [Antrihabitans sp. YC2-6]